MTRQKKYVFETMECGFAVHKAIGPGYGESIYKNAFCVELLARKIPLECEKPFIVKYRDRRHAERGTQENRALTEFHRVIEFIVTSCSIVSARSLMLSNVPSP